MGSEDGSRRESPSADPLDLEGLIPDHLGRYFAFFQPGHREGRVPSRIKELARIRVAALNGCDT